MSDRLEQLYDAALELPRDARASFIATACQGDAALRSELLSLVSAAETAEGFFVTLGRALFSPTLAEGTDEGDSPHTDSRASPRGVTQSEMLPEGTVIGRYQIAGQLGIGGMGTVYRAYDTRLDRQVALKFLAPHLTRDPEARERLLLEARAAAALQHPNICVVHEIGDTPDGQPFIAMALCEGDTLKHRLASGPIAPEEAVAIAAQVARALSAAHSRKIIHRDVKPGNIILETDGTVKLLDFGLAKLSVGPITRPGHTPGTIAYMSPEQVRGDPVDHRSDLWSLGVVLYEMLAGRRPFRGENDRIVLQVILHTDPEPLRTVGADVPARVASVVERLLRKNRESRYASAAAVLTDLGQTLAEGHGPVEREASHPRRRPGAMFLAGMPTLLAGLAAAAIWSGERSQASRSAAAAAAAHSREPSIAVLPLANLSADSGDAALAVGMTEELISTLARAGGARVIASTSTSGFRDRNMDVRQIADSLGVSNVLEGGIQKSGSQLRVEVRLIAARDGATLWSQAYSREFKDMFSVQDEIVRAVGGELGLRFDKERQLRRHRTRSIAAYELYLRGSDPLLLRSQDGVWKALEYFQQAIAADSAYAAAHAGLALVQVRRARTTSDPGMPLRELLALAENSARKAVALDNSLPEAHYALGRVLEAAFDFPSAEAAIRRAIALDPTRPIYHRALSYVLEWSNQPGPEEQLAQARRALETDPLNPYAHVRLAGALKANGRYEEALAQLDRVAAIQPPLQAVAFVTAQIYARQQRLPEAIAILRPGAEAGDPLYRGLLGYMLARAGQREEANLMLADMLADAEGKGRRSFQVAMVYAGLGDSDQTFAWLNRSVDDLSISSMMMGLPFKELQRDPRFPRLRKRLGFQR